MQEYRIYIPTRLFLFFKKDFIQSVHRFVEQTMSEMCFAGGIPGMAGSSVSWRALDSPVAAPRWGGSPNQPCQVPCISLTLLVRIEEEKP